MPCGAPSGRACPGVGRGRVDHDGLRLGSRRSHTLHHPYENAGLAPAFPPIIQRLVWAVVLGRISPPQTVAVDEDDAAQHLPIIDARLALALGKERPQPFHLLVRQPKQVPHSRLSRSLNQIATPTAMGPEPSGVRSASAYQTFEVPGSAFLTAHRRSPRAKSSQHAAR